MTGGSGAHFHNTSTAGGDDMDDEEGAGGAQISEYEDTDSSYVFV